MSITNIQLQIVQWNSLFPYDRYYRKKHNIAFGSEVHRNVCQIDAFIDIYEELYIHQYFDKIDEQNDRNDQYQSGEFWRDDYTTVSEQKAMEIFDKIDLDKLK